MRTSRFSRATGLVALVLPFLAAAESQVSAQPTPSAPAARHPSATAHVNFKIVIPQVLALAIPNGTRADSQVRVSISSNGRTVSLASSQLHGDRVRDWVLISARGRIGSRQSNCADSGLADPGAVTCTVSMP